MKLAVMMVAKDSGSMHRKEYLNEAERIMKTIYSLNVIHGNRRIVYRSICEPYCYGIEIFKFIKVLFPYFIHNLPKCRDWRNDKRELGQILTNAREKSA